MPRPRRGQASPDRGGSRGERDGSDRHTAWIDSLLNSTTGVTALSPPSEVMARDLTCGLYADNGGVSLLPSPDVKRGACASRCEYQTLSRKPQREQLDFLP
ncbi:MAG TPA: hypothetical protein QGE93_01580 [Acidobacteriota bacterium]|nr:hypothetical protein [Acidobacteriota bacterium]